MYVVVWEFRVKKGCEEDFERAYAPTGDWADFFKRGEGYLGSELLCNLKGDRRYWTLDRWVSESAYKECRRRFRAEYDALDRGCEALTEHEARLGDFATAGGE